MSAPRRRRIGFVVARYGVGIDGGSETLCREVATRLAGEWDLEVLTTTARDYLTWRNELPEGPSVEDGVRVRRFRVDARRWVRSFGRLSERLYRNPHTIEQEIDWMIRQGPQSSGLLAHLKESSPQRDAFVFFTYLYYPTYFGLPLVAEKSVLVPTLHDEPPAHLDLFRSVFQLPRAFVWNTPEEGALAERLFAIRAPGEVAGIGVDPAPPESPERFRERLGGEEFVLYLGRIDVWKGVPELLEHFRRYRSERAPRLVLALAGRERMRLPAIEGVQRVGYLDESEKRAALAGAAATIVPSSYESLSVVALESWAAGTPVLASARSAAVAGQCERSGGGLPYGSYEEFRDALDRLRSPQGRAFGAAGRRFVAERCTWDAVLDVYRRAVERAAAPRRSEP